MEQKPQADNDEALPWRLAGPDATGDVWLEWNAPAAGDRINLGAKEGVLAAFLDFMIEQDYGERA